MPRRQRHRCLCRRGSRLGRARRLLRDPPHQSLHRLQRQGRLRQSARELLRPPAPRRSWPAPPDQRPLHAPVRARNGVARGPSPCHQRDQWAMLRVPVSSNPSAGRGRAIGSGLHNNRKWTASSRPQNLACDTLTSVYRSGFHSGGRCKPILTHPERNSDAFTAEAHGAPRGRQGPCLSMGRRCQCIPRRRCAYSCALTSEPETEGGNMCPAILVAGRKLRSDLETHGRAFARPFFVPEHLTHNDNFMRAGQGTNLLRIRALTSYLLEMADGQSPTERRNITLSMATIRYLEALARLGTHGASVTDVARTLIEQGVRRAIEGGYLKIAEDAQGERSEASPTDSQSPEPRRRS